MGGLEGTIYGLVNTIAGFADTLAGHGNTMTFNFNSVLNFSLLNNKINKNSYDTATPHGYTSCIIHCLLQDSGYTSLGSVYADAYGPAIEMMNAVGENAVEFWGNQLTQ